MKLKQLPCRLRLLVLFLLFWLPGRLVAAAQAPATDSVSFVVLSHVYPLLFGGTAEDRERLLEELRLCRPEVLVLTGDVIRGSWNVQEQREQVFRNEQALQDSLARQWQFVQQYFGQLGVPVWLAPGNHDISSGSPEYRKAVREAFLQQGFEPHFRKTLKKRSFLFLNSTPENGEYSLSQLQQEWLQQQLATTTGQAFLFLHHPLWYRHIRPGEWQPEWLRQMQPLLNGSVSHVFGGDGDDCLPFFFETRDSVQYYLTGSGRQLASFLHVQCVGQEVRVRPVALRLSGFGGAAPASAGSWQELRRSRLFWAGAAAGAAVSFLTGLFLLLRFRKR